MPMNLIRELNAEHAVLARILVDIGAQTCLNERVQHVLPELKAALLRHLEREERDFYPVMIKAAQTNSSLAELLKIMGSEMDEIAARALSLIDQWQKGEGAVSFVEDFEALRNTLSQRIRREEHSLYAKYLKIS